MEHTYAFKKPFQIEGDYINRHFYHSVIVHAICQPDGTFSDLLAHFPESVHDSRIWKISGAGMYVENTFLMGEHKLGDSEYLLRPYLLIPYRRPTSTHKSKNKLTKEEEYTLIEAIQAAGDVLRGTGQSTDMNLKQTRLLNDVMNKINSIHGNNRDVKEVERKWNNHKGFAKARVDYSYREASRSRAR